MRSSDKAAKVRPQRPGTAVILPQTALVD
jgi:hypothetical protein